MAFHCCLFFFILLFSELFKKFFLSLFLFLLLLLFRLPYFARKLNKMNSSLYGANRKISFSRQSELSTVNHYFIKYYFLLFFFSFTFIEFISFTTNQIRFCAEFLCWKVDVFYSCHATAYLYTILFGWKISG